MATGSRRDPFYAWQLAARLASHRRLSELKRTGALARRDLENLPDLRAHYVPLRQKWNDCLGFSRTQCIHIWQASRGLPADMVDPDFPYWFARRRHGDHHADGGTYTRSIWWAGHKFGDVLWRRQQISSPTQKPSARLVMSAVDIAIQGAPIFDRGGRLVWRVIDSLRRGQTVQLSLPVEASFLAPSGPAVIDAPSSPMAMGHAVTALAARPDPDGEPLPQIAIGNSYGENWREGGVAWLKGRYVAQAYGVYYVSSVEGF